MFQPLPFVVSSIYMYPPNSIETTHINIERSFDMIWLLGNKLCNKYLLLCMCVCVWCVCVWVVFLSLLFLLMENMLHEMDSFCVFSSVTKISFFFLFSSLSFSRIPPFGIHDHFKQTITFNKTAMDPTIFPYHIAHTYYIMEIMMIIASLIFITALPVDREAMEAFLWKIYFKTNASVHR